MKHILVLITTTFICFGSAFAQKQKPLASVPLATKSQPYQKGPATIAMHPMMNLLESRNVEYGPIPFQSAVVSSSSIAFSYAGEIWTVRRIGGEAQHLTKSIGVDTDPVFSTDGKQIAFSRRIQNNVDVYVISTSGGEPRRLTYHPKQDVAVGWTPDGAGVLFASNRASFYRSFRLYTIPVIGGSETELPFPIAQGGSFSADGTRIAYMPWVNNFSWRNYHGGWTSSIRIGRLSDSRLEDVVPHETSNDSYPMWKGNKIYFVSERTGTANLFLYDLTTKKVSQQTNYEKYDIKSASMGEDAIAFIREGGINLYDLKTGQIQGVKITIGGPFPETTPRMVKAGPWAQAFDLSPTGAGAVFSARGDILVSRFGENEVRNLTKTPDVAERFPVWSPDGNQIAYFSDEAGEYQLHVRAVSGEGGVRRVDVEDHPSFYSEPVWSPDAKKIAFSDKRLALWYADLERGTARRLDVSTDAGQGPFSPAWSPDGRWLAYSKTLSNRVSAIFAYSMEGGKTYQITDGRQYAELPVFDSSGNYLYFLTSHNTAPTNSFGISVIASNPLVKRRVQVLVLNRDGLSPLSPIRKDETSRQSAHIDIDAGDLSRRIITLPIPARDYVGLVAGNAGVIFLQERDWTDALNGEGTSPTLLRFDLSSKSTEKFIESTDAFTVSRDGNRLLYRAGATWAVVSTDVAPKPEEGKLNIDRWEVSVDPRSEWQQMYNEVWRIERDYFYDANLHGQDLQALKRHYAAYLPNVASREDLNRLFKEMLSHLSIGHMAIGGGDQPPQESSGVGLLGADYTTDHGRYRITRIYRGDPSHPLFPNVTSPLAQPGVAVKEGDYLLGVDDQEINTGENLYSSFVGKVSKPVRLRLGSTPDGRMAHTITVSPLREEDTLRRIVWASDNRQRVQDLSGGKLAYICLSDYELSGFTTFVQEFYAQVDKQGVIVDQRFNPGGFSPDYIIEALKRVPLSAYTFRSGDDIPFPLGTLLGPRVLIINEFNGSGADTFAWMWREAKVGPLIGKRTTGAGIGSYVSLPELIDGGTVSAPNRAFYNPKQGVWDIENQGVAPDIELDWFPADWRMGRDPQLERAIQIALEEVKRNPPARITRPKPPAYK